MRKPSDEKMLLLASIILFITTIMWFSVFKGCGVSPSKKVVIEQPSGGGTCDDTGATTRNSPCKEGQDGQIVEICNEDKQWTQVSNTCKTPDGACDKQASWESSIKEMIVTNCAECHGTYRDYENVKNIAKASVGGVSGVSKLLYYVNLPESDEKHMPKGRKSLKPDDLALLDEWVKKDFPLGKECAASNGVYDIDYVETVVLNYLSNIATLKERENYRFFSFAGKANLKEDITNEYKTINQALNSLSFANDIYLCKPIDKDGIVCAIDMREYGLSVADFGLIDLNLDVKFISKTTKGTVIQQLTKAKAPILPSDLFIDTVFGGDSSVYYTVMGFIDADQTLKKFGVDFKAQIAAREYKSIGTNESLISAGRNTRLINIHEGEVNGKDRSVMLSFDNPALAGAEFDLFQSPFLDTAISDNIYKFTAGETIMTLPNGLFAYFLQNNLGVLQPFAPETIVICNDPKVCLDATINNPVDCFGCHNSGFIPKVDTVRSHILNSGSGTFDPAEIALAKQVYNSANVNAATFNEANFVYEQGIKGLEMHLGEDNHFINTFNFYNRSQNLEQIAAFLLVKPEELKACIEASGGLRDSVGALITGGKITHDTFKAAFDAILAECEILEDPLLPE